MDFIFIWQEQFMYMNCSCHMKIIDIALATMKYNTYLRLPYIVLVFCSCSYFCYSHFSFSVIIIWMRVSPSSNPFIHSHIPTATRASAISIS